MRAYSFTLQMLSTIQQGVQPAHCINDLHIKYAETSPERARLIEWSTDHKTMICLNGGTYGNLLKINDQLKHISSELVLPYGYFCEDDESLCGLMTCCTIIVPSYVYDLSSVIRSKVFGYEKALDHCWQPLQDLAILLAHTPMAR